MFGRIVNNKGVTFIELMATLAILSVLTAGILPLSQMSYKRAREIELRQNLRVIRKAIDQYKQLVDDGKINKNVLSSGYPINLNILVEGTELSNDKKNAFKMKFLRRIPKDPMTEGGEWGLRSYSDEPASESWGGQDVYDVYSTSDQLAIDGSKYREW